MTDPLLTEDFGERLASDLSAIARTRRDRLAADGDALPLAQGAERILASGKRLRPAFAYWTWRACGGERASERASGVVRAGSALELFQAAALVHDDLIDDSPLRRGIASAHRHYADAHAAAGHPGPADAHGRAAALLLGDLLLLEAEEAFGSALATFDPHTAIAARAAYADMCRDVTVGQFLDVSAEARPWSDPVTEREGAHRVIELKSASYSVLGPVRIGAILAGAHHARLAALSRFGTAAGRAFQLRDDLLGVFGTAETTGKPAGGDLREGKRTVLVALALEGLAPSDADLLRSRLGRRDLDEEEVTNLTQLIEDSGAPARCEELITALSTEALAELEACDLSEPGLSQLRALTSAALHRVS